MGRLGIARVTTATFVASLLLSLDVLAGPVSPPPPTLSGPPPERSAEAEDVELYTDLGLKPQADGTWKYVDRAGHFTALFLPDGTVQFADRWRRPDRRDRDTGKCCALPPRAPSIGGGYATSGPVEWVARIAGEDLNARAKAELLQRTAEVRTRLAIAHTKTLLDLALDELTSQLRALWADESLTLAERRERLFALWDECDELIPATDATIPDDALSDIDRTRLDAAWLGRRKIEAFIRHHLPSNGADAYTDTELDELNERRVSVERFEPYVVKPKARPVPASTPEPSSSTIAEP